MNKDNHSFYVQNRFSENMNRIWVSGGRKKDLIEMGIKDIISKQNFYNWDFSITLDDAEKLGLIDKEAILLKRKFR